MSAVALPFISATIAAAAEATGVSETRIKAAISNGDLVAHYNGNRPVLLATDLMDWIESLPTERAA